MNAYEKLTAFAGTLHLTPRELDYMRYILQLARAETVAEHGAKGGKAAAANMTPAARTFRAKHAAHSRWAERKPVST